TLSGRFALVHKKHVTEEERLQLGQAFTHGIEGGQLLLRQLRTSQCLAVSQSLLTFLEQTHTCFLDRERAFLFTALFNLIGMAFLHQKAHQKAFKALHSGYLSALGAGDAIGIVSNLLCQANAHYDLGHYQRGIEIIQQALRTLDAAEGSTVLIMKAHLFGVWADCAMTAGKFEEAYQQLNAIESLLEEIPSNEEFDVINWYQLAGKCAGLMGDFATSERLCRQGLQQLPQPWNVRHLILLMPLFATSVSMRDLEASLALLEQLTLIIPQLDAPFLRQPLTQVAQGMLMAFPQEQSVKTRVAAFLQTMH
ncbi:MAG: hypothetical protein J2P36_33070, partial [Ktedonobacteraceae bacterium]|nr:hypothetical protein [Ktedonobacteraceae bacterium]